ncbi:MAG: C39 family peptidase [Promethearchaeota archaeon]
MPYGELEGFENISASQRGSQWCWAACIEMVLNYNNVAVLQRDIVERSYGRNPFTGQLPDWPASWQLITANLNGWGLRDREGDRYRVMSEVWVGPPNLRELAISMDRNIPIIIGTNGHAMVVIGVRYRRIYHRIIVQSITVYDPWPGNGETVYNPNHFINMVRIHWNVFVEEY